MMEVDNLWPVCPEGTATSYALYAVIFALFLHICLVVRMRALERTNSMLASALAQLQEDHTTHHKSHDRFTTALAVKISGLREKLASLQKTHTQLDRYVRELLPPPLPTLCANAAGEGDLARLKELRDPIVYGTRAPWNEDCCTRAAYAKKDRIPLLEWLRDPATGGGVCPWNDQACNHAFGDTNVLEWLRDPATGGGVCPWNVQSVVRHSYDKDYATAKKVFDMLTPEERRTAWPADSYHAKMFEDLDYAKLTFGIDGYNHNLQPHWLYRTLQTITPDDVWAYLKSKGLPQLSEGNVTWVLDPTVPLNRAIDVLERLSPPSTYCKTKIMQSTRADLKAWFTSKYGPIAGLPAF